MRERPILFSGPMVSAILDGRKTQTRRVIKPQPGAGFREPQSDGNGLWAFWCIAGGRNAWFDIRCPYGEPHERLWVREGFKQVASGEVVNGYGEVRYGVAYKSGGAPVWQPGITRIHDLSGQSDSGPMQFQEKPWKPSIHMPRRFSRITLEITNVRVERIQDITEADAQAEGRTLQDFGNGGPGYFPHTWDDINKKRGYGWDANPWVWVIEFKKVEPTAAPKPDERKTDGLADPESSID